MKVAYDGLEIFVRFLDTDSKLSFITSVYYGGNYIPSSVRRCLTHSAPFSHPPIRTFLTIDEKKFQISLNYLGHLNRLDHHNLNELIEEFGSIAEKWRNYLDEHDKHDLVHVRVK
ncbi:MAG: hypothetical protein H0V82_05155 [Candidatus Protochlamydia sp.]|nr:hypothetical protein [Candidatus Protochlamydia sp.]